MNHRYWHAHISFVLIALVAFPALSSAQLSSTNYQVDVYGVGEENAGSATSSQYQIDGVVGSSFEDSTSVSNTAEESGATSGSVRTARETSSDTDPDNPTAPIPESSTQSVPESVRNQGSDLGGGAVGVSESSDAPVSSDTSLGGTGSDKTIANETPQETADGYKDSSTYYLWVLVGGLAGLGIFYVYRRRKIL